MISNVYLNKLLDDKLKSLFYTKKMEYLTIYMIIIENLTNLVNLIFCMRKFLIMYNVNKLLYIYFLICLYYTKLEF